MSTPHPRVVAPPRAVGPSWDAGAQVLGRVRESVLSWTDPAARHRRRLLRARASARTSTVAAAVATGASAVLLPWHGVGAPDSFWVALTAGTVTATVFAWQRVRRLSRYAPPPAAPRSGSAARPAIDRLTAARRALSTVLAALGAFAGDTGADAAAAAAGLADLAGRVVAVEAALSCCPPEAATGLHEARRILVTSLQDGVSAYEDLLAAAAGCTAAAAPGASAVLAGRRLAESADRLRGITAALGELAAPV